MTVQDVVDRVAGSWLGPLCGLVVALVTRCVCMGAIEPLARRFQIGEKVPERVQAAVKEYIDRDRWRVPLYIQLSSLPAFTIPALYVTSGGAMDDMAWGVFLLTSLPVAMYNASKASGADDPFEAQPHFLIEGLAILVRVFFAMLVLFRIQEYHKSEKMAFLSSDSETNSEVDSETNEDEEEERKREEMKNLPEPSNSNFMTPVSRLPQTDPEY
ncbi:hypothetical protein BSKO_05311 [Bryopsis sp. KO-2023]|nr:hypothetical protein BSKO_05311 [Bryopsis sp. KO-2023]